MKIIIDYNNDEIRIEEAGPMAYFEITRRLKEHERILEEIFNRLFSPENQNTSVTLLTEDEDKLRIIGEW